MSEQKGIIESRDLVKSMTMMAMSRMTSRKNQKVKRFANNEEEEGSRRIAEEKLQGWVLAVLSLGICDVG